MTAGIGVEPVTVRVWANVQLGNDPEEAAKDAAAHAALRRECEGNLEVVFDRNEVLEGPYLDAWARGEIEAAVPILRRLGELGHSYAVDVYEESAVGRVLEGGGDGVFCVEVMSNP